MARSVRVRTHRRELIVAPFDLAAREIRTGYIILFQKPGILGQFISRWCGAYYTHAGMAVWENGHRDPNSELMLYDITIFRGGAGTLLRAHVADWPECVDVYRVSDAHTVYWWDPDDEEIKSVTYKYDPAAAADVMRSFCVPGRYGYYNALRLAISKVPWLNLLLTTPTDDDLENGSAPTCSQAVSYAVRRAFTDIVRGTPDMFTHPGDLVESPLTHYLFTLGAPGK